MTPTLHFWASFLILLALLAPGAPSLAPAPVFNCLLPPSSPVPRSSRLPKYPNFPRCQILPTRGRDAFHPRPNAHFPALNDTLVHPRIHPLTIVLNAVSSAVDVLGAIGAREMKFNVAILVAAIFLLGCSDSKVVLPGKDGGRALVYDLNNFHPQVETAQDIVTLVNAAAETLTNAANSQAFVTVQEISDAMQKSDWRQLEKVVVEYRAAHRQ